MGISRSDITDADIVDAVELASTGNVPFRSENVVSTTNGTNIVLFDVNIFLLQSDEPVGVGDTLTLAGTTGANGNYKVLTVYTNSLKTVEPIPSSTGGVATFFHPSGATRIGISTTNFTVGSGQNLQEVLNSVDSVLAQTSFTHTLINVEGSLIYIGDGDFLTKA